MNRIFALLLLLGIVSIACAPTGADKNDLGAVPDFGMPDLGAVPDFAAIEGPAPVPTLSLIAGKLGGAGSVDGIGPAAHFGAPKGVAMDGAGNLYVADYNSYTIRQIVLATGAVTTVAGIPGLLGSNDGPGAAARFYQPTSVAVDDAGNVYVADSGNSTIRKIVVATGSVTTLAGTAGLLGSNDGLGLAARFNNPRGLAMDGAGNLNGDYESAYIG